MSGHSQLSKVMMKDRIMQIMTGLIIRFKTSHLSRFRVSPQVTQAAPMTGRNMTGQIMIGRIMTGLIIRSTTSYLSRFRVSPQLTQAAPTRTLQSMITRTQGPTTLAPGPSQMKMSTVNRYSAMLFKDWSCVSAKV